MRTSFIYIVAAAALLLSCAQEKNPFAPVGGEKIVMSSSVEEVVLNQENDKDVAVKFTWSKGYEYNDNVKVTYCFKIDIADNNFETATELEVLGEDVYEKVYTVEQLNDLCLEQWNITPGETVVLEAKVIARHTADKFIMPQIASTTLAVKPYNLESSPLYIIGDAISLEDGGVLGWNPADALLMTEEVMSRVYSIKCSFVPGEYLFLRTNQTLDQAYGPGEDKDIEYYAADAQRFYIGTEQVYTLRVNVKKSTLDFIYHPEYESIFMVGDASPNGWEIADATPLTWIENTAQFVYEGPLKVGELKFAAGAASWDVPFYMATEAGQEDLSRTGMQLVQPGGVDYKWKVTEAGNYKITLDIDKLSIKFVKQ